MLTILYKIGEDGTYISQGTMCATGGWWRMVCYLWLVENGMLPMAGGGQHVISGWWRTICYLWLVEDGMLPKAGEE